jgi:cobalamin biosynthesis Mg chelatase CobN
VHLVGGESTASGATNRTITATSTATAAAATTTTTSAGAGATIDTSPAVTPAATLATPTTSAPAVSTVAGSNFSGATTLDARFCAWLGFVAATAAALLFAVASV